MEYLAKKVEAINWISQAFTVGILLLLGIIKFIRSSRFPVKCLSHKYAAILPHFSKIDERQTKQPKQSNLFTMSFLLDESAQITRSTYFSHIVNLQKRQSMFVNGNVRTILAYHCLYT